MRKMISEVATILNCVLFIILTLIDRWSAIAKWGGLSMLFKISLVFLILAVISTGFMFYFSKNEKKSKPVEIIKNPEGDYYLVEGNNCSHIPDKPSLQYLGNFFGLDWVTSQTMLREDIKRKFNMGKELPTITLYFPK